jgi:hypothetical protein
VLEQQEWTPDDTACLFALSAMSRAEFANALEVSEMTVGRWLGKNNEKGETIQEPSIPEPVYVEQMRKMRSDLLNIARSEDDFRDYLVGLIPECAGSLEMMATQ